MKTKVGIRTAVGLLSLLALPAAAFAQDGSEVIGQPLQVTTNGVTNTVYLDPGGTARILTPSGNTVPGNWSIANGQLCLSAAGGQECWPYTPFQASQPQTLTSSCNQSSTWLAAATNTPPPPVERGERGK